MILHFINEFVVGVKSYWKALTFIREHRLYWYYIIPALLMLAIYFVGNRILHMEITPNFSNMNGIVWYFIYVGINISVSLLLMKFAKYLVVILLSPLLSHLSQRCENILTGNQYPIDIKQIYADVKRGVRLAIRNMLYEYFYFFIILLFAYFIWDEPTKSPLFYLTFIIGFYYYGFSFIDYDNERRKLNEVQSIQFVRSHRGLAMGIGMIYSLLILVPVDLEVLFSINELANFSLYSVAEFLGHLLLWISASISPILAIVSSSIAMEDVRGQSIETIEG